MINEPIKKTSIVFKCAVSLNQYLYHNLSLTAESPIHAATYIYNGDFSLQIKTHSFQSHDRQLCGVLGRGAWHRPGVHMFELGHPVQHSLEPRENLGALGESGYDHSTKLLIGNHTYKNETGLGS